MVIVHLSNKQRRIISPEKGETLNNLFKRFCLEFGYAECDYEFGSYPEGDDVSLDMAINASRIKEVLFVAKSSGFRRGSMDSCYATIPDEIYPVSVPNQQQQRKVVAPTVPLQAPPIPPTARPIMKRSAPRPPVTMESVTNNVSSHEEHSTPQQPPDIDIPPPPAFLPNETERATSLRKSIDCGTDDSADRRWSQGFGGVVTSHNDIEDNNHGHSDESGKDSVIMACANQESLNTNTSSRDSDEDDRLNTESSTTTNGRPVTETLMDQHQFHYQNQQKPSQEPWQHEDNQEELLMLQQQKKDEEQKQKELQRKEQEEQKQKELQRKQQEEQKQKELQRKEQEEQKQKELQRKQQEEQKQKELQRKQQEEQKQKELQRKQQEEQKRKQQEEQKQKELQRKQDYLQLEYQREQKQDHQQDLQKIAEKKRQSLPMVFYSDSSNSMAKEKGKPKLFYTSAATVDFIDEEDISVVPSVTSAMAPSTAQPMSTAVTTSTVPKQQPRHWWELPKEGKTMQFLSRTYRTDEDDLLDKSDIERPNIGPTIDAITPTAATTATETPTPTAPVVQVTVREVQEEHPESERPTYRPRQGKQLYFTATRSK